MSVYFPLKFDSFDRPGDRARYNYHLLQTISGEPGMNARPR